jgi:hypothetical protein
LEQLAEGISQQLMTVQPKGVALLGLAQGVEEGGAVRVVAQGGWVVVALVACVVNDPIGHESRLASHHPSLRVSAR